jgi:hypothetical protein
VPPIGTWGNDRSAGSGEPTHHRAASEAAHHRHDEHYRQKRQHSEPGVLVTGGACQLRRPFASEHDKRPPFKDAVADCIES